MRKLLLALVFLVVGLSPAAAQNWPYVGYARITVDSTSGGVSFPASVLTSTGHVFPSQVYCFVETADIRWTVDGTAPTTSIGNVAAAGSALPAINGSNLLVAFRAIQDGASSATLSCNFFAGGQTLSPLSAGSGGSGSGGGGGGSVTQGTDPWIVSGGGTAGNPGINALTIQGIASGTAVTVAPSSGSFAADSTHDAAAGASGPQIMLGATSTYQTSVTTGDASRAAAGLDGILIARPQAHVGDFVKGLAAVTDGSSTSLVAAQGSGVKFCATTLVVSNSSASNVTVDIRDGTAGSVIMTIPAVATAGAVIPLQVPLCTSANTAMAVDPSAAASTVTTTAVGFRTAQ